MKKSMILQSSILALGLSACADTPRQTGLSAYVPAGAECFHLANQIAKQNAGKANARMRTEVAKAQAQTSTGKGKRKAEKRARRAERAERATWSTLPIGRYGGC